MRPLRLVLRAHGDSAVVTCHRYFGSQVQRQLSFRSLGRELQAAQLRSNARRYGNRHLSNARHRYQTSQMSSPPRLRLYASLPLMSPCGVDRMIRPMPPSASGMVVRLVYRRKPGLLSRLIVLTTDWRSLVYFSDTLSTG